MLVLTQSSPSARSRPVYEAATCGGRDLRAAPVHHLAPLAAARGCFFFGSFVPR